MFSKIKKLFGNKSEMTNSVLGAINDTPAWAIPPAWATVSTPTAPDHTVAVETAKAEASPKKERAKRGPRKPKAQPVAVAPLTPTEVAKAEATAKGEPWVAVISLDMDMDNVGAGSFNLDWNDIFVARLIKAGYRGADDVQIVDQWFTDLARNIALETFQQEQADPDNRK